MQVPTAAGFISGLAGRSGWRRWVVVLNTRAWGLYADALAEGDHGAARRLGRGRRVGPRGADPAGLRGAAPPRAPPHGRRAAGPQPADHRARQRGLRPADRLEERALAEPRALLRRLGAADASHPG